MFFAFVPPPEHPFLANPGKIENRRFDVQLRIRGVFVHCRRARGQCGVAFVLREAKSVGMRPSAESENHAGVWMDEGWRPVHDPPAIPGQLLSKLVPQAFQQVGVSPQRHVRVTDFFRSTGSFLFCRRYRSLKSACIPQVGQDSSIGGMTKVHIHINVVTYQIRNEDTEHVNHAKCCHHWIRACRPHCSHL